jgi:anti-sigma regulatory factor (Ser/Thr protein kinase)
METAMTSDGKVLRIGRGNPELIRALGELGRWLDANGVGDRPRFQAELVLEELVTNVIRYGYDDQGAHLVDVALSATPEDLIMVVSDDGRPFNPLERAAPELPASLAEAHVGGLGIMLVRKATRDVSYERSGGRNRLTVVIARD